MTLRGWWRRRQAAMTKQPEGLLRLPDPMLDTAMVMAAQGAAQQDYESMAYDEFLFSEENLDQMPYERMVDDPLSLTRIRLFDQARRAVLQERRRLIEVKSDVRQLDHRREAVLAKAEAKREKLDEQREILEGKKTGRAELLWPGTPPQQTTLPNAMLRLLLPYAVFVIVGGVDVGIILKSFQEIFPKFTEAILFTLPAVGVQVVFPHFIGDRINLLVRKYKHPVLLISELAVLTIVWLGFVITLAQIRMNYVTAQIQGLSDAMYIAIYAGFICMILGLGLWLLLVAVRHNPHETAYARLNYSIGRLEHRAEKLRQKSLSAEAAVPAIEEALDVAEQGYRDAIDSAPVELAEAVKSVYRRVFINLNHDVDFTSAYLGIAHPNAKKARGDKKLRRAEKKAKRTAEYDVQLDEERRRRRDTFTDSADVPDVD